MTSKKLTWSEAVKFCADKGGTLASRGSICPNGKPSDAPDTGVVFVPVSDGSKPEYMYYGKDSPNVSGDGKTLYACELHSEWPAHKGGYPTWAENHQRDSLKSNRVYCSMDQGLTYCEVSYVSLNRYITDFLNFGLKAAQ